MDHDRFPITAAYLERLPAGLDAHPQCFVKASVLRDAMHSRPFSQRDLAGLPQEVAQLITEPRPVSAWIREVYALVAMLAVRDRQFAPGEVGLIAYGQWTYQRNRRLLARPLYRALFLLLSPDRLLRGVGRRWSVFRKGTSVELLTRDKGRAMVQVAYPPFLYEETIARGLIGALRAATELAGGRDVDVHLYPVEEQATRFEIRWT